jgi:hypothetical protein
MCSFLYSDGAPVLGAQNLREDFGAQDTRNAAESAGVYTELQSGYQIYQV